MYFKKFPKIYYILKERNNEDVLKIITDITTNVRVKKQTLSSITLWQYYDMKDGETPEIVAERFYGNAELHWVIMLVNDRYDVYNDFPLTSSNLENLIAAKYITPNATKHYVKDGLIVDSSTTGSVPLSHRDWEIAENEKKRRIKMVEPNLVFGILEQFDRLIK
jgi:hypothetical protein